MKDDPLKKIIADVGSSIDSFTQSQKELHKIMCNPDMGRLQSAIESKREADARNRIKELEVLNESYIKQIKLLKKRSNIKAIICGVIVGIIMYHYPAILNWISRSLSS